MDVQARGSAADQRMNTTLAGRVMGLLAIIGTAGVCLPPLLQGGLEVRPVVPIGLTCLLIGACVTGIVLLSLGDRLTQSWCYLLPVVGVAVWTVAAIASTPETTSKVFLCWAVLYAAYFYRPIGAWLMTSYCLVACAVVAFAAASPAIALTQIGAVGAGLCGITAVVTATRGRELVLFRRLSEEAHVDSLTGLSTRRVLTAAFDRFAQPRRTPIAFVLTDVDNLKAINDTYGHPTGDQALVELAALAQLASSSEDVVARLGGDETGVLMPGKTYEGAMDYARRLQKAAATIGVGPDSVPVSISVGVATAPGDGEDLRTLYAVADQRLYERKRALHSRGTPATQQPQRDERDNGYDNDRDHDVLEDAHVLLDLVPALPESVARDHENRVPDQAASCR